MRTEMDCLIYNSLLEYTRMVLGRTLDVSHSERYATRAYEYNASDTMPGSVILSKIILKNTFLIYPLDSLVFHFSSAALMSALPFLDIL